MNKNEIIKQIRKAYVELISFKNAVQKLHLGVDLENEIPQLDHTESAFGKWFYNEAQYLNQLKSYKEIKECNEKLYRIYQAINKLIQKSNTKNESNSLFTIGSKKSSLNNQNLIDAYCKDFLKANTKLAEAVRKLYNEVLLLPAVCFREDQLILLTTT